MDHSAIKKKYMDSTDTSYILFLHALKFCQKGENSKIMCKKGSLYFVQNIHKFRRLQRLVFTQNKSTIKITCVCES